MSEAGTKGPADHRDFYTELLRWAYEGEVFGEAFLAEMLGSDIHSAHRVTIELLHQVEDRTLDILRPLISKYAIDVDEATAREVGETFSEAVSQMSWDDFVTETQRIATEALPKFRILQQQGERDGDPDDRLALAVVVAHEDALCEFARLEAEGSCSEAIRVLERHLTPAGETRHG